MSEAEGITEGEARCIYCGRVSKHIFCSKTHAAEYANKVVDGMQFCRKHEGWHREQCGLCRVEAYAKAGHLRAYGKNACGVYHAGYLTPCTLPVQHAGWHMGYGVSWENGGYRFDATGVAYAAP